MITNDLTVAIYARGSTTRIADPAGDLKRVIVESYETSWPGGLYGPAALLFPRDVTRSWLFAGGNRVAISNGLTIVYEGYIAQVGYGVGQGADQWRRVNVAGASQQIMGQWSLNKPWADNRIDEKTWEYLTAATGADQCTLDRNGRLRFIPKGVAWATNDYAGVIYTAPTGQTIKRITYDYDLQEGAQAWRIALYNVTAASEEAGSSITASGTGSIDDTLASASQSVWLFFAAAANQTPTEDGTYYGEFSNIVVYTETGSINLTEIAKDVRAFVTDLNSDETQIASNTLSLVPFITGGRRTTASILAEATSYGDSSFNSWYWDLLNSDSAATPNGEPVLRVAQYPALTDYDYSIRLGDKNLAGTFEIVKDTDGVKNWVVVKYTDDTGKEQFVTPDDDANLTDATSVTTYGRREGFIDAGWSPGSSALAISRGRRYLALYKDPRFYVSGPVTVIGWINAKNGQKVPAANIKAGMRLRVLNFLTDEAGVSGAGMTWHISRASYNPAAQTCAISTGVSDDLAVYMARLGSKLI